MNQFTQELLSYRPRLQRYAIKLTRDHDTAEDLLQDTLARALAKQHLYNADSNMFAWLGTMMHNLWAQGHVSNTRKTTAFRMIKHSTPRAAHNEADATLLVRDLTAALNTLAPETRALIVRVALHDESYDEIATATAMELGTIRSRLARGRQKVRGYLDA